MTKRFRRAVYSMLFADRRGSACVPCRCRVGCPARRLGTLRLAAIPILTTKTMSATREHPPRKSSSPSNPVVFGCLAFTFGAPLVAALVWPSVMLVAWSVINGPKWETLTLCAGMVLLILGASFFLGYFLPATLAGGIMGAIGTRIRRRWFVLLGTIVGTGLMVGYVLLQSYLLTDGEIGGINGIAILDSILTSAVMSHWLHRRLERAHLS
ncbi:hypothetical protein [Burkholderia ambifaria]|uniref:hypothetical protein n=1 Tax=Burkholderia ambifaria TaxID=152480 RepID=UPI001FC7D028|nr:hypothetical protein [Burkholderia ambifaria]WDR99447.1 hypothetical protein OR985_15410 [Burkholderia ambifaria]